MVRIRCADGALHVASGAFLRRAAPFALASSRLSNPPQSSSRHRWLTGTEGTKAVRDRRTAIRLKPAEVSSAQGRSSHTAYCVPRGCAPPPGAITLIPTSDFQWLAWVCLCGCAVWSCVNKNVQNAPRYGCPRSLVHVNLRENHTGTYCNNI